MATQNQNIRKILIAPDKFKGSLTSAQAAEAIRRGIEERFLLPDDSSAESAAQEIAPVHKSDGFCAQSEGKVSSVHNSYPFCAREEEDRSMVEFRIIEIADGGDGSLEVLQGKLSGSQIVPVAVQNPVGKEVASQILIYRISPAQKYHDSCQETQKSSLRAQNGSILCPGAEEFPVFADNEICAFIEMAKVSGLEMLSKEERNPLQTSSYGMGEAIKAAIGQGATQITLSIGGSATNDGGAGMLQALVYRFFDVRGREIAAPICGGDLERIAEIRAPYAVIKGEDAVWGKTGWGAGKEECIAGEVNGNILSGIKFKVVCDVTNPLLGSCGSTAVYGPQKGADARALQQLEAGLANYASVAEKCLGVQSSKKEYPGAGAAGGVGYAGLAFLGAELVPGWKFFAQITSLEESVQWADLVITGEGSLDSQSLSGKVVSGVLNLADKYNKKAIIFCGISKLPPEELGGIRCYSIASLGHPLDVCMRDAAGLLRKLARESIL